MLTNEFDEFINLLQACLHDEGVFATREMSKVASKQAGYVRYAKAYLEDRHRYLLFDQDICLIVDQDTYYQGQINTKSTLSTHPLIRNRLGLLSCKDAKLKSFHPTILDGLKSLVSSRSAYNSSLQITYPKIGKWKTAYRDKLSNQINYCFNLEMDLPSNLNMITNNDNSSKAYMKVLIELIASNIKSMRETSPSDYQKNAFNNSLDLFSQEESQIVTGLSADISEMFLSKQTSMGLCLEQNDQGSIRSSSGFKFGQATVLFECCPESWFFGINQSDLSMEYISREAGYDQSKDLEQLHYDALKVVEYMTLLYHDINKTLDFRSFL